MMGKLWSISLPWDEVGTGPWASLLKSQNKVGGCQALGWKKCWKNRLQSQQKVYSNHPHCKLPLGTNLYVVLE